MHSWGVNVNGELGIGTSGSGASKDVPEERRVGNQTGWSDVSAGGVTSHGWSCGIRSGRLLCWGTNLTSASWASVMVDATLRRRRRSAPETDWRSVERGIRDGLCDQA